MTVPDDEVESALDIARASISDPKIGLPDPVFKFVLKVTTMINVDLLIREPSRGTLATWRVDDFGQGWHIPGGIVRFYEPLSHRLSEVARLELGATIEAETFPCDLQEFFRRRGHFISLLYRCKLTSDFSDLSMLYVQGKPKPGMIGWFVSPPAPIYPGHEVYAKYFQDTPKNAAF